MRSARLVPRLRVQEYRVEGFDRKRGRGANGEPTKRLPISCILLDSRSRRLGQSGPFGGAFHHHRRVARCHRYPSGCPKRDILQRDTTDLQTATSRDRWQHGDRSSDSNDVVCAASLARLGLPLRSRLLVAVAVAVVVGFAAAAVVVVDDAAESAAASAVESSQRSPIASSADPHPTREHSHDPSTSAVWKASTPRLVVVVASYPRAIWSLYLKHFRTMMHGCRESYLSPVPAFG